MTDIKDANSVGAKNTYINCYVHYALSQNLLPRPSQKSKIPSRDFMLRIHLYHLSSYTKQLIKHLIWYSFQRECCKLFN